MSGKGKGGINILVAFLIGVCLVASGTAMAVEQREVRIMGHANHMKALVPLVEEFEKENDHIKITILSGIDTSAEAMLAAYLAGALPDIIEGSPRFTSPFVKQGLLADLTPFIAREPANFMSQFYPMTLPDSQVNGRYYSLPAFLQIEGMYFNSEVLESVGLAAPQPGWTWEDLKSLSQKARRYTSEQKKEVAGIISEGWFQSDLPLLGQAGGAYISSDFQVVFNSTPTRQTFKWIEEMIDEDLLDVWRVRGQGPNDVTSGPLWYQKTAFSFSASYRQDTFTAQKSAFVTAPPLRYNSESQPASRFTDRSWCIGNVSQEQQQAAWEVIKYFLRPQVAGRWLASLGYPPAIKGAVTDPHFRQYMTTSPNMQVWTGEYTTARSPQFFPSVMEEEIYVASGAAVASLHTNFWVRKIGAEEFINEVERILQTLVTKYR